MKTEISSGKFYWLKRLNRNKLSCALKFLFVFLPVVSLQSQATNLKISQFENAGYNQHPGPPTRIILHNIAAEAGNRLAFIMNRCESGRPKDFKKIHQVFISEKPANPISHLASAIKPDVAWSGLEAVHTTKQILPWYARTWFVLGVSFLVIAVVAGIRAFEIKRLSLKNRLRLIELESEKLKELDHLKSHFFANISHEFRTPLTLILGPVEKLLEDTHDSAHRKSLVLIHKNAEKLLALINELLELSKLESGNYQIKVSPGDFVALLNAIVMSFASKAEQKNIKLGFTADPNLNNPEIARKFLFDRNVIEKILNNLLSNAFKFTHPKGSILVLVCLNRIKEQKQVVEIVVKDTGIGISAEKLPFIFDRFYQADSSPKRSFEGVGIGLAFVKELVSAHKGSIEARSRPGKGTIMTVRLPVGKEHFAPGQISSHRKDEQTEGSQSQKTVRHQEEAWRLPPVSGTGKPLALVVEDHHEVMNYIGDCLEEGFRVKKTDNAIDGERLAFELIPDLIISDVMMPGVDGFEFCEKLKADQRTSHIPIILLTAKAEDAERLHGIETGADEYLTKPFIPKELLVRATNLVKNRRLMRQKFSTNAIIKPGEISVASRDRDFMEKLLGIIEKEIGNEELSVEMLADKAGISHSQLHRRLKALINQTPSHFIRSVRMLRAKELLESNTGNIAEISYQVGYDDPGYFTKSYKAFYGVLPSQNRKTIE